MHHLKSYHAMLRKPLNVWNFQFLHSAFQKLSYEVSTYRKNVKPIIIKDLCARGGEVVCFAGTADSKG